MAISWNEIKDRALKISNEWDTLNFCFHYIKSIQSYW